MRARLFFGQSIGILLWTGVTLLNRDFWQFRQINDSNITLWLIVLNNKKDTVLIYQNKFPQNLVLNHIWGLKSYLRNLLQDEVVNVSPLYNSNNNNFNINNIT